MMTRFEYCAPVKDDPTKHLDGLSSVEVILGFKRVNFVA